MASSGTTCTSKPMAVADDPQVMKPLPARPKRERKYGLISPRFWHGMLFSTWMRMVARNRFAIAPRKLPMACAITAFSVFNSVMRCAQEWKYGERADAMHIKRAPIFIIGHWRSGTTLLHELMVLDPRHNFPTTFQCFAPSHFLLSEDFVTRWLGFVLPTRRPMDNMETGWDKPQEDEFALCNLGMPSPYLYLAFPNRGFPPGEYLDLEGFTAEEIRQWQDTLLWFMKRITLKNRRRIILKSPPHTARIRTLLEVFPEARFIHIARDPYAIYPSTIRLWKSLGETQGLQVPRNKGLHEYVLSSFERMYARYFHERDLVDPARFYELRYEDLVSDPVGQVQAIYDHLDLGGFQRVRPRLAAAWENRKDYRPNRHELDPEVRQAITERWAEYIRRYGYDAS